MSIKAKTQRNNMFYSDADFLFDQKIGMDYIAQDINQYIMLFRVDRTKTNVDRWGDATSSGIVYKEPVELNVLYVIDVPKNLAHDKKQNVARFQQIGNLKFDVFEKTLVDAGVDVSYGDYVGIQVAPDQMEYWVVTDDGRLNFDNAHSLFGKRALIRSCSCTSVDKSEFNGI